jgi:hypothetical protein
LHWAGIFAVHGRSGGGVSAIVAVSVSTTQALWSQTMIMLWVSRYVHADQRQPRGLGQLAAVLRRELLQRHRHSRSESIKVPSMSKSTAARVTLRSCPVAAVRLLSAWPRLQDRHGYAR